MQSITTNYFQHCQKAALKSVIYSEDILIKERFLNDLISVKTYPGKDFPSDYGPLIWILCVRLKRLKSKKIEEVSKEHQIENIWPSFNNAVENQISR